MTYFVAAWSGFFFFFQAEDGIRDGHVTGVQTCALPIFRKGGEAPLRAIAACLLALLALAASPAEAAEWGLIVPGTTTMEIVRARYGQPTKSEPKKVDSYDTVQWVYEGAQAPVGMYRMTVDFGLLTANGYQKDVVRDFRLDAKPGAFNKKLVLDGWGDPSNVGKDGDFEIFLYEDGLLVYFDTGGWNVQTLVFTVRQPAPAPPQR